MSNPTSSLVPVLSYLQTAIVSQLADTTVSVHIGTLAQDRPLATITVGTDIRQAFQIERFVGGGGTGWMNEGYTVFSEVDVSAGDADMTALLTRAQALVESVWAAVRNDPSLGGLVLQANPLDAEWRPEWRADRRGPRVTVRLGVFVQGQL